MFEIESIQSKRWSYDPEAITDEDLSFRAFLGSVRLRSDKAEMNFDYDWIPLVDFASAMLTIQRKLLTGLSSHEVFEFTESDEKIIFDLSEGVVTISNPPRDTILVSDSNDFKIGIVSNYVKLIFELAATYPALKNNNFFSKHLVEAKNLALKE